MSEHGYKHDHCGQCIYETLPDAETLVPTAEDALLHVLSDLGIPEPANASARATIDMVKVRVEASLSRLRRGESLGATSPVWACGGEAPKK